MPSFTLYNNLLYKKKFGLIILVKEKKTNNVLLSQKKNYASRSVMKSTSLFFKPASANVWIFCAGSSGIHCNTRFGKFVVISNEPGEFG